MSPVRMIPSSGRSTTGSTPRADGDSDADLDILLDRSAAAFAREKGWSAGLGKAGEERAERIKKGEKTAFEVFVPAKDDAADGLATMFGGDGEKDED